MGGAEGGTLGEMLIEVISHVLKRKKLVLAMHFFRSETRSTVVTPRSSTSFCLLFVLQGAVDYCNRYDGKSQGPDSQRVSPVHPRGTEHSTVSFAWLHAGEARTREEDRKLKRQGENLRVRDTQLSLPLALLFVLLPLLGLLRATDDDEERWFPHGRYGGKSLTLIAPVVMEMADGTCIRSWNYGGMLLDTVAVSVCRADLTASVLHSLVSSVRLVASVVLYPPWHDPVCYFQRLVGAWALDPGNSDTSFGNR